MRRFALAVLVVALTPLLMGAGQQAPQRHLDLSQGDRTALDAISANLNAITTLKGAFTQIEPSGALDEGAFYISKPGKLRFEYRPPAPTLIVADGHTVAVANRRLGTVDRYPLNDTPLGLVVNNTIDLRHDSRLVAVDHQPGMIVISLRTSQNRARANIALVFSEPDYELRQWSVVDDQGSTTTVSLHGLQPGAVLAPGLFILPDKNSFAPKRPD